MSKLSPLFSTARRVLLRVRVARSGTTPGVNASTISIVDADPDLAEQLDDEALERARHEALTRVQRLSAGEWNVADALEPDVHHRGFLVVWACCHARWTCSAATASS